MLITYGLLSVPGLDSPVNHHSGFTFTPTESTGFIQQGFNSGKEKEVLPVSDTRRIILDKALGYLESSHNPGTYRFTVTPRWIPGSLLRIEPENIREVVPEGSVERYTNFKVTYVQGNRHSTSQIQLMVETERKIPVANRRIINGETIEREDLEKRWVSVPYDRGQLVDDSALIEGKIIRRTLANGQPVRHADVSTEYLVEAGDTVRLILEEYGIRIEITAEARQSGAQDEEIRIYNNETRKRYLGRIIGPGVVQWLRTL